MDDCPHWLTYVDRACTDICPSSHNERCASRYAPQGSSTSIPPVPSQHPSGVPLPLPLHGQAAGSSPTRASQNASQHSHVEHGEVPVGVGGRYLCPVFKYLAEYGARHNLGDEDDVLLSLLLPAGRRTPEHWVVRNVAVIVTAEPGALAVLQHGSGQ